MRRKLRPFYSPEQLTEVYAQQYDHTRWADHICRIAHTANILREMKPASVADLSCGDGAIVTDAGCYDIAHLGDYVSGWDYTGPIDETIHLIPEVDVFLLSETLEHVEDPDTLLRCIRGKAKRLLLSTPHGEDHSNNPEHYWGWDAAALSSMLAAAGWYGEFELFTPPTAYYIFQIWRCH